MKGAPDGKAAPEGKRTPGIRAQYDAAGRGRRMQGWNPPSSGPNRAITGLQTIRNRARDSSRNDWSGASAVQKWSTNLVGIGITPRFKDVGSVDRKRQINLLWKDFVQSSDADGVLNFYGQQTLAVRTWLDAGEVFIRRRNRFLDEGLPVPMQVQLLEPEMVPLLDATSYPGMPNGNVIRSGIEFNKRGRRIAYWIYKEHPGDGTMFNGTTPDLLVRVPADEVAHMFDPVRPGQVRGVSMLAPVLARLRTIENYDDATLTRQQLANLIVAFISRKMPPMTGDEDLNGLTGQESEQDAEGRPLVGLQPGLVQELDDGQEVTWSNPPEAGTTYSDYMRTQHMGTSAAAGLPYELFSGDLKEVSDRTLRVAINEFRRLAEQRQWQIVIPMMCVKALRWFADAAVLSGDIAVSEFDAVRRAEWATHGWAHIHPVQDPQGKALEVEKGFRSRSSVIGERGDDPDEVDAERAADKTREDDLGLTPVAPGEPADPDEPPDPDDPDDPADPAQP
jgi:lambda family phage portal protein